MNPHSSRPSSSWLQLKQHGKLQERHVQMAIELGYEPRGLILAHHAAAEATGLLLLEWVEDRYFARFQTYSPVDEAATPERQQEHPAENSLVPDPFDGIESGDEDDEEMDEQRYEEYLRAEREAPASYGEIYETDQEMLRRQENFRKAAKLLAARLGELAEVRKVVLFGSVALPLWKEVPRFARLRHRKIKVYHECGNIDLAVWVTATHRVAAFRKAASQLVNDLVAEDIHFSIAHHVFSIHLIDPPTERYLGMVCHFNACPKGKPECLVPGCGASPFVRVLSAFVLKPERLNPHNSQILFDRPPPPPADGASPR